MNPFASLFVLAVGLAMDATAAAAGMGARGSALRAAWQAALAFGLAQAGMSALGALGGRWLTTVASAWDHWIALTLLCGVAAHMVWEARQPEVEARETGLARLGVLALATSIDALAAGITLPLFALPLRTSLLIIGLVTAGLSAGGALLGVRIAERLGHRMHDAGALLLVLLGLRIVYTHLQG